VHHARSAGGSEKNVPRREVTTRKATYLVVEAFFLVRNNFSGRKAQSAVNVQYIAWPDTSFEY